MSDKYPGGFVTANAPAGFSVAFDGSSYLSVPSTTALQLTTGTAFTIEAWVYPTSIPADNGILGKRGSSSGASVEWQFFFKNDRTLHLYNGTNDYSSVTTISSLNQWVHAAVTWDLTTLRFFLNGVLCSSTYTGISLGTVGSAAVTVGADYPGGELWYGYLSNVRLVKGTALYTSTFTPPTQMFPVTNTQLLTCQSPTIVDNSSNAYTVTAIGNAAVSNFTPFAAYQGFNPALGAAAGGVWTIDEAAYYQQNRLWPIYDPYFNQTTLMLHGNGANGAQNNTFLDSSTNNFTITRNGNTTQGSFSPFSQTGWSFYGTGATNSGIENLQSATSSQYAFGTGDWCVEMWFNRTGDGINPTFLENLIDMRDSDVQGNGVLLGTRQNGSFWAYDAQLTTAAGVFSSNTWNHVAYTRQNGAIRIIVNGILQAYNGAYTNNYTSTNCRIKSGLNAGFAFSGYVSNVRVIKGNVPAQYQTTSGTVGTGVFTPPTAPLTVVTGTSLLTCQDGRLVDNSANNFALTVNGTPSVQAFSPFVPAYITPTTYSNFFSSGNLTTPSSAAFNLSSGDWTIEGWFLLNTNSDDTRLFTVVNSSTDMYGAFVRSGTVRFGQIGVGEAAFGTLSLNTLTHIAFVKTSTSTITCYINGISTGTTTSYTLPNANCTVYIAASPANYALSTTNGAISNFRVVKGTAVYTANFTPPTAPLTNITNTSLLTCQSSTFIDNSTNNFTITSTGNVQPVTSPTPFPANVDTTTLNSAYSTSLIGGSGYFDGTGDYLTIADTTSLEPGTGDFTWETWVYHTTAISSTNMYTGQTGGGLAVYRNTSGYIAVDADGVANIVTSASTVPSNTWTHVAATRSGTSAKVFLNGVLSSTATNSTNIAGTSAIGFGANPSGANLFAGYLSGTRFIKGTALYTSAFAPPITPPTPSNLTNNGTQSGTLTFVVGSDAPNTLYYVCQNHSAMAGTINIVNSGTYETVYAVTANGSSNYVINGSSNPTLTLVRGQTYTFNVNATGHPFWITTASGAYSAGNVYLGTTLLTNFTNGAIFDNTAKNVLETVGNAQISTTQSKYGGTSIYAGPAAADYVLFPYSPNLNFGAGDFTIECWLFWTGGTSENTLIMNNASGGVNVALTNSGTWQIGTSYVAWQNNFGTTPTQNVWHHLAISRKGSVIYAFIDGVQIYTGANSTNYTNTSNWYIADNGAAAIGLIGYIDDFRITNYARYITNFTPPTSQLQDQ